MVLNAYRRDNYEHPAVGLAVVLVLVAWTGFAIWAYGAQRRRTPVLLGADLLVAMAAMALTPVVKGDAFNATIPGFWVMGALLAWAIHWYLWGGVLAALALSATDLVIRDSIDQGNYGNLFLLLLGGPIVGYMCGSLVQMATERDEAQRWAAAAGERARLARAVHDGVLQVLTMVQRRGSAAGGEWADLGRLAGEQEHSLRSLIRAQDTVVAPPGRDVDLSGALEALGPRHLVPVEVVTAGTTVDLPSAVVAEIVAVVGACLDNVAAHAGPQARAWVLLEPSATSVSVSVRDDGPGIPDGRLEQAQSEGRLGVAASIRGRIEELGGTARVESGSWGTEWVLEVPRSAQH